jgi:hypothetical protein
MDTSLVNENAIRFKDRVVRMTPELFKRFGLVKDSSVIKVEEFRISCIPFDLSLSGAKLLSFLNEKEIAFFVPRLQKKQKLSLTCFPPDQDKPISLYINITVSSMKKPEPASPYCFIEVIFGENPQLFKEMLVSYFLEIEAGDEYFRVAQDIGLLPNQIPMVIGSNYMTLLGGGEVEGGDQFKVSYLSPKRIRFFGEYQGFPITIGTELEFESTDNGSPCSLKGKCTEFQAFDDAPGFFFLGLDLYPAPLICAKMRTLAGLPEKRQRG